jgi:hypothetical protein
MWSSIALRSRLNRLKSSAFYLPGAEKKETEALAKELRLQAQNQPLSVVSLLQNYILIMGVCGIPRGLMMYTFSKKS